MTPQHLFLLKLVAYASLFAYPLIGSTVLALAVRGVFYLWAFVEGGYFYMTWIRTIRVLGFPSPTTCAKMLRLRCRRSGAFWSLVLDCLVFVALVTASPVLRLPIGLCISGVVVLLVLIMDFLKPPAVLILGSSGVPALSLQKRIRHAINDLHVISLMDCYRVSMPLQRETQYHSFRVTDDDQWINTMHELADLSRAVVVDVREEIDVVVYETSQMLSPRWNDKTYFLIGDNGEQPSLDRALSSGQNRPPSPDRVRTETLLLEELKQLLI